MCHLHLIFRVAIGRLLAQQFIWLIAGLFLYSVGCQPPETASESADGPLQSILCTTGMVGDMVSAVAGPEITVTTLMGPGIDPHLFSPSPQDSEQMARADAIVYSGLHLEAGLSGYLEKLAGKKSRVYAVADGISDRRDFISVGPELYDPHFWNDLQLWQAATRAFAETISSWDPQHAEQYRQRAETYCTQLDQLLADSRASIQAIPQQRRVLITAHDAFEYLGRSLNLEVAAVQGISTDTEANIKRIEQLVETIVSEQIPAIFAESSVSDKAIRALIEGAQKQGHSVQLGGTLYSDALGPPGSGADTFPKMYEHNINTITSALK